MGGEDYWTQRSTNGNEMFSDVFQNTTEIEFVLNRHFIYLKFYTKTEKYHLTLGLSCIVCDNHEAKLGATQRKFTVEQYNRTIAKVEDYWNKPIHDITFGLFTYKAMEPV